MNLTTIQKAMSAMTIKQLVKQKIRILVQGKYQSWQRVGRKQRAVITSKHTELFPETQQAIEGSRAKSTRRTYNGQWTSWIKWQEEQGLDPLDTTTENLANYFSDRYHRQGKCIATIIVSRSAISCYFKEAGKPDPTTRLEVERTLQGLTRHAARNGYRPKQAAPLTEENFDKIKKTAHIPRISYGGRLETKERAERRGDMDLALIATMRPPLLRRSEAAALAWGDIDFTDDGTGSVHIRRSKTDQMGKGSERFLNEEAVKYLLKIKPENVDPSTSVFGCSGATISNRISAAAKAAGLKGNYTGHSPRVGMAVDLARDGASLVEIQHEGRWSSPNMPAYYIRSQQAGRGAVSKYFSKD